MGYRANIHIDRAARAWLIRLGILASECIFADDVPRNLEPAQALGITTVLVDDPADAVNEIARLLDLRPEN